MITTFDFGVVFGTRFEWAPARAVDRRALKAQGAPSTILLLAFLPDLEKLPVVVVVASFTVDEAIRFCRPAESAIERDYDEH